MANKRIKDLSTTAAVTASDDFIAVDGSANGTRKLNAFSPTFGGNLTLAGNIASNTSVAFPGALADTAFRAYASATNGLVLYGYGTTYDVLIANRGGARAISVAPNSTDVTTGGNLTVSGTGGVQLNSVANLTWGGPYGANIPTIASPTGTSLAFYPAGSTSGESARFTSTGNLLLGTTTDSGNGKLQLATHTTSAGGIGFGTDTALYRTAAGRLLLQQIGGTSPLFGLSENGTTTAEFQSASGDVYLTANTAGKSLILRTVGTTALTLDSSQQAKFSSAVYCNTTTQSSGVAGAKLITKQTSGTNDWTVTLDGNPDGVAGASYGLRILAGTNSSDYSLYIRNQTNTTTLLAVKGSGRVNMGALPTSSTGLSAGDIWNDAGTLKIV